ncbi:hypothetical protein BCR35DRAFT_336415 [Leucosporidium creatinivorum]|uniref:RING-type domain-containing protein n=1 Tax=Leucosporidium creatinivorum TaxID=106004 RepID=A0A1Y2C454_9BASI|nr:hypothetical protein BCR35DRAFT_336415 [Leucosporidium creatinivorum]
MPRHARNNTSASTFTYAERQMLKAGSKKERLGRDAMKNFNACSLCLEVARDPRSCLEGHLYCQECIVTSLLAQKKDIKRQNILLERMRAESEEELAAARAAARERVVREFESAQTSLGSKTTAGKASLTGPSTGGAERGTKRKFDLDEDEIERLAKEATEEAMGRTAMELAESRKAKLPNFWLPSLTPSSTPDAVLDVKLQTLCQVAKPAHPISLKSLTVVKFETEKGDATSTDISCICPCCRKSLTNNVKAYVVRPCGDVLCNTCVDTLCRPDKACAHCGTGLDVKKPFIELKREGTGFAAGGQAEAKRFDLAFQG